MNIDVDELDTDCVVGAIEQRFSIILPWGENKTEV